MYMHTDKEISDSIRDAGFRATKPRIAVISFLTKSKYPLAIQKIVAGLKRTDIDQVTVYRTLDAFKKRGLVAQVDFQHGHAHYELKDKAHDHHHLVCTECSKVEDFTGCQYDKLVHNALRQTRGFAKVTDHSLELFGLCNRCATA